MKVLKILAIATVVLVLGAGIASSQTWAPLNHQPGVNVGPMLQLRDGRILFHEEQAGNARNWWILTPDSTGSYLNGLQSATLTPNLLAEKGWGRFNVQSTLG